MNIRELRSLADAVIARGRVDEVRVLVRYFLDAENTRRIDRWRYSPACCPRIIETVF